MVYSFIVIKQKLPFVFDKKIKITEDKSRILLFSGLSSLTGIFGKYVLEINTMPGMTETSLLPKIATLKNIDFETLVEKIVCSVEK